jgi:outer membrane protein
MHKFSGLVLATFGSVFSLTLAPLAQAETLADVIRKVYQTNPQLLALREQVLAQTETYAQARAGWRPSVAANGVYSHESTGPTSYNTQGFPSPFNTSNATISVSQPLYTGGRALAAVQEARRSVMAGQERLRSSEQAILQSAATAYSDLLMYQKLVVVTRESVGVLRRQLEQTRAQFKAGDATRTDVAQAESRVASGEADFSGRVAQLAIARANYQSIVGSEPEALQPEPPLGGYLPRTVDEAFTLAEQFSPDISSAKQQSLSSEAAVAAARAQQRPYVALQGSVGGGASVGKDGSPFKDYSTQVVGSVNVNIPLYSGGAVLSQVRQATHLHNADVIQIESQRRSTVYQVAEAWNRIQLAIASERAYTKQVDAARIAAEGARQEEQAGYRETIEVLNAQLELRNAEVNLAQSRHDQFVGQVALLARMGRLDLDVLAPGTPRTDTDKALRKAGRQMGWVPWESGVGLIDHLGAPSIPSAHKP